MLPIPKHQFGWAIHEHRNTQNSVRTKTEWLGALTRPTGRKRKRGEKKNTLNLFFSG